MTATSARRASRRRRAHWREAGACAAIIGAFLIAAPALGLLAWCLGNSLQLG